MRFRFNPTTGRLGRVFGVSTPATLAPKAIPEAPTIHFPTGTTFAKVAQGASSTKYAPVPKELAAKFKHFQIDNNLPVHIRGGVTDKVLYAITALVCGIGLIECFHVYYVLSYPAKKEE